MHQNVETIKDNEILKIKICWKYELIIMAVHVDTKTSIIKMKVYVWLQCFFPVSMQIQISDSSFITLAFLA